MSTISPAQFAFVRELVRRHTGIVIDEDKQYLVELRLGILTPKAGYETPADLVRQLEKFPLPVAPGSPTDGLIQRVIEALTNNETMFFRDWHPFQALRTTVLPPLIEKRRLSRQLTIWCAGCASGQEPYSVAMLLAEHFPEVQDWPIRIFATDVNRAMLERAREGKYNRIEINRGLPAPMLLRHFTAEGESWRIHERIRKMVEFREVNLNAPWPALPTFDLILLRNVLIYFAPADRKSVLCRMAQRLDADGWLLLGGAEAMLDSSIPLERQLVGQATFLRPRRSSTPLGSGGDGVKK